MKSLLRFSTALLLVAMTTYLSAQPYVEIFSSDLNEKIISGQLVTFSADDFGSTTNPTYQWRINGTDITGAINSTYTTNTLQNGDAVTVLITDANGDTASSAPINITVAAGCPTPGIDNWTAQTIGSAAKSWSAITYGNGLFVAVANGAASGTTSGIATSPDGVTWTERVSPEPANTWQDITFGNGIFVAISNTGTNRVITSPDGITWTAHSVPLGDWRGVAYGNGTFVAVGFEPDQGSMYSTNGVNWTFNNNSLSSSLKDFRSLAFGNGMFMAVYSSLTGGVQFIKDHYTSNDGVNWTYINLGSMNYTFNQVGKMAYGNGVWVVTGFGSFGSVQGQVPEFQRSTDGVNFTSVTTPALSGSNWPSVCYAEGNFIAVSGNATGGQRVMSSPDGLNWTLRNSPSGSFWTAVTYGNGKVVAIARNVSSSTPATTRAMVSAGVAPSVTLTSDDSDNSINAGETVTFTATPTNGGVAPTYQWFKNGAGFRGLNDPTYVDDGLMDGDVITVQLLSDEACAIPDTVSSVGITMEVIGVLPVEMLYFNATKTENGNLLTWATATEENNAGFEVEKSTDARTFKKIGFVVGNGTTIEQQTYEFLDKNISEGVTYYRLKQLDFDGQFEYSKIVNCQLSIDNASLKVYPNPVQDELTITEGVGMITIYNALGQPVKQIINENETIFIIDVRDLPKGIYSLQLRKANGEVVTTQFVK